VNGVSDVEHNRKNVN